MSVVEKLSFTTAIDNWVADTEARMTAVFKESTQRVFSLADNGVPVDTGFARASPQASTEAMPSIVSDNKGEEGKAYPADFGQISAVIANAKLGQTIYVGWTASYVLPLEYGHSKHAPSGFVRIAAAQWGQVVSQVTEEAKARAAICSEAQLCEALLQRPTKLRLSPALPVAYPDVAVTKPVDGGQKPLPY